MSQPDPAVAGPTSQDRVAALEQQLAEAMARLTRLAQAHQSERLARGQADEARAGLQAAMADGLAQARFEITSLEQRMLANVVALTQMVETQRSDLEALVEALRSEVEARRPGRQRQADASPLVDDLERQLKEAEGRLTRRAVNAGEEVSR